MKSWKMHLHLTLNYKIASSSQNLRIRYNPWILCIISLSFASLLITVWSPDSIYLYLDLFLLKFLFISKPSEWVLTFRFSPFPAFCKHPGVHLCDISGTCAAWVTAVSQNSIFHIWVLRRLPDILFPPSFRQHGLSQQNRNCWLPLSTQHTFSKPQWMSAHKKD